MAARTRSTGPDADRRTGTGTTRERLVASAFALFDERGYDGTTVDDIAEHAGVGRTTFFRTFRTKEDVIFPDHEAVLGEIEARLASADPDTATVAVSEAARTVLAHYVDEGDLARARYELTRSVPALRDREISGIRQYQRLFRTFLVRWWGDDDPHALRAELMADSVVAAHNHVLRRWLRRETADPFGAFDDAMRTVFALYDESGADDRGEGAIVAFRTTRPLEAVLPTLRAVLGQATTATTADERIR
jgi:AcrR family transcriptional regulator